MTEKQSPSAPEADARTQSGWVAELALAPPRLSDNTGDAERLARGASRMFANAPVTVAPEALAGLPGALRAANYAVRAVLFPDRTGGLTLVHAEEPASPLPLLGLAVDLGTTTIALRLLDLASGKTLGETTVTNPQAAIGPDVLTRIHHAEKPSGLQELANLARTAIARNAGKLCAAVGSDASRIMLAAVSGNTAMTQLFLGLPSRSLIREPYIPVTNRPGVLPASFLGLSFAPACRTYVFPNIGSYFGGDGIAGILATGMDKDENPCLLVDVGTNAEVVLGNRDFLIACAGAAGPALEGGITNMGMPAGPGAIDAVSVDPETREIVVTTIGNEPPRGICGSGVIDLAAGLLSSGMMDIRGRFVAEACGSRLIEADGMKALVVVPASRSATGADLVFTQADLASLTRSKAAMYTILRTITKTVGIAFSDLGAFYVAGTFGAYIKPESAVMIGMVPDLSLSSFRPVGNTSLAGAALALTDRKALRQAEEIAGKITYLELNVNQEFMNRFSAAKFYPHTDITLFPTAAAKMPARSGAGRGI
ncbi:MAG: ASKHA domain-containing protein [Thermodesulfobacteriota bacterium]